MRVSVCQVLGATAIEGTMGYIIAEVKWGTLVCGSVEGVIHHDENRLCCVGANLKSRCAEQSQGTMFVCAVLQKVCIL